MLFLEAHSTLYHPASEGQSQKAEPALFASSEMQERPERPNDFAVQPPLIAPAMQSSNTRAT